MGNHNFVNEEKPIKHSYWLYIFVALLILSNIATVLYFFVIKKDEVLLNHIEVAEEKVTIEIEETEGASNSVILDSDDDGLSDYDEINMYFTDPKNEDTDGDGFSDKNEIDKGYNPLVSSMDQVDVVENLSEGEILVEWDEWSSVLKKESLFGYQNFKLTPEEKDYIDALKVYKIGEVINGEYKNKNVYILSYSVFLPGGGEKIVKVIKNDKEIVVLQNYNTATISSKIEDHQNWGEYINLFSINNDIKISNMSDGPETILIPNSKLKLLKKEISQYAPYMMIEIEGPEKLFEYKDSEFVYRNDRDNCFFIKAEDGTAIRYFLELDFSGMEGDSYAYAGVVPTKLDIVWDNGEVNNSEYVFQSASACNCGRGIPCMNYAEYISDVEQLEKIAKTKTGYNIYELNDMDMKKEGRDTGIIQEIYDGYYPGFENGEIKDKISFEDFLKMHPLIFWETPFGDFAKFQNAKFLQAVECGKPVIYLYPEEEMDINVFVEPTGGFTITEPAYKDGWHVRSTPNSEIYNYSDKSEYSYLFWEGYGLDYKQAEEGFVVRQENVHKFLVEKLAQLGLVKNEYDEFIEFWEPKMQESPYYLVNFIPKAEFDEYAPLKVEPEPDTVIRIFMDYKELNYPVLIEEPEIVTPERTGFTVVEWGGALHR